MNDLRTGFIVEGVLHINVPVLSILLAGIHRESLSVRQHKGCLLEVTLATHFSPSPLFPPQDCTSLLTMVPTLRSPSILSTPSPQRCALVSPSPHFHWFPVLLDQVQSSLRTTKSCLCRSLPPHLSPLPHSPYSLSPTLTPPPPCPYSPFGPAFKCYMLGEAFLTWCGSPISCSHGPYYFSLMAFLSCDRVMVCSRSEQTGHLCS